MSRFVKDIYLGCPEEAVEEVVQDYLSINEFHETEWNGEHIWGKDSVYAPNYRLFDYRYQVLWPVILVLILIFVLLPYLFR